ncbi:hypothetical protein BDV23DRAFT_49521 [Aspergillus alliaceus]|uniref:Uncharacterized protein n=1 Tax=Petromyces alliaceus TaxID=209559 RepID=A0A5N7BQV3_PETAA|nr:hypothetical protein BDV23DRAFT_49521 [Aspergillus alliaceus]
MLHTLVYNDTVSGALKTAAIAPFICHPPPPAAQGHPIARCGIVLPALGIARTSRRFCPFPLPPHSARTIYISPNISPSNDDALSSSFLPFLQSLSPGALPLFPLSEDAVLSEDCPFPVCGPGTLYSHFIGFLLHSVPPDGAILLMVGLGYLNLAVSRDDCARIDRLIAFWISSILSGLSSRSLIFCLYWFIYSA